MRKSGPNEIHLSQITSTTPTESIYAEKPEQADTSFVESMPNYSSDHIKNPQVFYSRTALPDLVPFESMQESE